MKPAITHIGLMVGILAVLLLALPAALCATEAPAEKPGAAGKPNIVFIFADDWGWGDLSCHGHAWLKTPNLDRLASAGIDFQQFNVLNPVCSPSRTAVMTGHYPARYSVHQHFAAPAQNHVRGMPDWLDPKAPTLPRILKQAGYRTAHFGKWHLTNRETHGAPAPAAYGYDEAKVFNGGAEWPSADLHATAENAIAFIRASAGKPFFVNVWLHESHTPHVPTKDSMEKWKHLDEQKQVYSAVITDGDNAVGRILAQLKESGVDDNTLVLFSSDNGPESTAKVKKAAVTDRDAGVQGYDTYYSVGSTGGLRGRKRSLFEGGVRTPFIVRWPGHTPAGVKNAATAFTAVDLLPTLCAAAGVTLPADYKGDGENLLDAFNGKAIARTRPIFWEWLGNKTEPDWWPRLAVREGDWKLAMTGDAKRVELHRLDDDRAEAADVAKDHPDIVARLTKLALDWKATLPARPNPECLSAAPDSMKTSPPKSAVKGATPAVRAKAFDRWDTNHDGFITLDEYEAGLKGQENLEARFKNFDKNGDGKLTREEFIVADPKQAPPATKKSLKEMQQDFLKLKFGMFIHFNLETFKGVQWVAGYHSAADFDPGGKVDTDAWADAAVSAGMKYAVLTAKHVSGFCLWDSQYTTYDVMNPDCPYQQDLVAQFIKSFKSRGLKVGLYYCWRHPGFKGQFKVLPPECDPATHSLKEQIEFQKKQVAELLEKYPDVFYIWNDALDPEIMPAEEALAFFRSIRPDILVSANWWDWGKKGTLYADIAVKEMRHFPETNTAAGETCWCLEKGWFWNEGTSPKTARQVGGLLTTVNSRNSNFLLNVGPNKQGRFEEASGKVLAEIGKLWRPNEAQPKQQLWEMTK